MSHRQQGVSILVAGIGGYGFHYLQTLFRERAPRRWWLAGVVDPVFDRCAIWPELRARGVSGYRDIAGFYAAGGFADLAVISSPIHWHVPQSVAALEHGADVLCEKPIGATVQEASDLAAARDRAGRWVMIGYQWSFSGAALALKHDIQRGVYGTPLVARTICLWPRDHAYYARNSWAGRVRDPADGRCVFDSPANNGMAHFLHNLFFLLGSDTGSARPAVVEAEMYRAYGIENADTCTCRAKTTEGTTIVFYASHATRRTVEPRFAIAFDEGNVRYETRDEGIVGIDKRGREHRYGAPDDTPQFRKLHVALRRAGASAEGACGPEAAASQTQCMSAMQQSCGGAADFPAPFIETGTRRNRRWVRGLEGILLDCYRRGALPSERGAPWAERGKVVAVESCIPA